MDCIPFLIKYIITPFIKLACNILLTTVRTYELCFKKQACKDADDKLTLDQDDFLKFIAGRDRKTNKIAAHFNKITFLFLQSSYPLN